jgi:hypothetical protein
MEDYESPAGETRQAKATPTQDPEERLIKLRGFLIDMRAHGTAIERENAKQDLEILGANPRPQLIREIEHRWNR